MDNSKVIWNGLYQTGDYAPIVPYTDSLAMLARYFLKQGEGRKLLEIGCGIGQNLLFARWAMCFDVTGIDYSESAIARAKQNFADKGLTYEALRVADAAATGLPDDYFDAVIERAVLQQNRFDVVTAIVREICRVLKPGGVLSCALATEGHFLFGQGESLGGGDFFNPQHDGSRHFFARRDLLQLFEPFEILRWSLHTRQDVLRNQTVEQFYLVEVRKPSQEL